MAMNNRSFVLGLLAAVVGVATTACSASSGNGERETSGLGSGASGNSGGSGGGSSGGSSSGGGASNGSGATGAGTNIDIDPLEDGGGTGGSPETCDGIDNDNNDIVDDLDVGKDGVCDCLNIATIGDLGPWSDGTGVFATWLAARSPLGATALGDEVLTDEVLAPFQVVVTLHTQNAEIFGDNAVAAAHHVFTEAETTAMTKWVENGGGLMTTSGYNYCGNLEEQNLNTLISPLGFGYEPGGCIGEDIIEWIEHPVTDGIEMVNIVNGGQGDGTGTPLGFDSQQRVALQVVEAGMGRSVMWSDEWITYDSEWADTENQQIERFWLNILKWLSPAKECQVPIPPTIK
jgi:hypothetical protein